MKKNLLLLTGIVFVLTILLAGGCKNGEKQKETTLAPQNLTTAGNDTAVKVFLKEIEVGTSMHLLMSDSRKPEFEVIDGLITNVKRGDTIKFMKGKNSKIKSVEDVRLLEVEKDPKIYKERFDSGGKVYYQIILDSTALPNDTFVKYEIHFTVRDHKDTVYIIDPYLKLPKQQ